MKIRILSSLALLYFISVQAVKIHTVTVILPPALISPNVTINQAAAQPDPASLSPINYTVVFDQPIIGFTTGDITLTGTAGAATAIVTGGPATFNVAVSGMTGSGTVIAAIPAGVCTNAALEPNNASTSTDNTVTYNLVIPPGCLTTVSYTGPAVPIPDNNAIGINIPITVAAVGNISDLDFRFDAAPAATCDATPGNTNAACEHTFIGDLIFKLTSPALTTVTIVNRRGGARRNICTTLLDDDNGYPSLSTVTSNSGQFLSGNFAPDNPLSAFDGQNANGVWTLNVSDNDGLDIGSMRRFSLIFTGTIPTMLQRANDTVCVGSTAGPYNFTSVTPGATFAWTNSNTAIGLGASGTGNIPAFTATNVTAAPITATITVTPAIGTCNGTPMTFTITVYPTPNPGTTITYAGSPYCSNAGTATVTQTGTPGGTYLATPAGLTINVATGAVTLGTSTTGTYTVTYTIAASGGCPVYTTSTNITITALPVATISYAGSPYCSTDLTAPVTRTGNAGGTYSSTAGLTINAATGTVTPNTSTPGTYTVTYTIPAGGGCAAVAAATTITITQAPNAIIFYANNPYCSNAGTATVMQFGTPGGTYSAAPAGLTINAATGAVTLATSTPGTYTVTYTIPASGGCGITITTTTITVTAAASATIAYTGSPYCSNAGTANVTRTGTAGGTYSATPAGLTINAATGAVTLGTSTPGTYTVIYTIAASGGCPAFTTTASITITALPAGTISYTGSPYCSNGGTATVTRTGAAGGTYTAAPAGLVINAATGDVNLATSTPGTYTVTYTIAASGGCPAVIPTTTITITQLPAATIGYAGNPYCQNAGTANITRTGTAGGTYTATPAGLTINVLTGTVTLGTSTPGTYTVTYTIAASGGCLAVTATTTITVNSVSVAPTAATASPAALCGPGTATLSVTGGSLGTGGVWRWHTGSCGGTLIGTGATLNVTVTATTTYFVRAEGTCNTTTCASVTLQVNPFPVISISAAPPPVLLPGQSTTITATVSPAGGSFAWVFNGGPLTGATGSSIGPLTVNDIGTYYAIYTDLNGCVSRSNDIIVSGAVSCCIYVYPNPNTGQFHVRFYNLPNEDITVRIFDLRGALIHLQTIRGNATPYTDMQVDLRNHIRARGTYIVEVRGNNGTLIRAKQVIVF
jgi:subtilisin-like proprotein convertase family protein